MAHNPNTDHGAGGNIISSRWLRHDIPHYYGDYVREIFVGVAVLSLVTLPIWGNLLPFGLVPQIGAAILLVLLAGLTNPHGKIMLTLNAIVAGFGALLLEATAISLYNIDSTPLFAAREAAAILLLFAFYFSVKTIRAQLLGKLGTLDRPWEFEEEKEQQ